MFLFFLGLVLLIPLGLSTPEGYYTFYDEGSAVFASHQIAQGKHLYKDLWYFKGPLSYYGLGLVFKIFGASLAVARIAGAFLLSCILTLTSLIAWRLVASQNGVARWESLYASLMAWGFAAMAVTQRVSWHNSWCVCFLALAAILAAINANRSGSDRMWFLSGFFGGLVFLAKQSFGLWLIIGIVILFVEKRLSRDKLSAAPFFKTWMLGWAAAFAGWLIYSAFAGSLGDFFRLAILYPLHADGLVNGLIHPPPNTGLTGQSLVFYALPILLAIIVVKSFHGTDAEKNNSRVYGILALCLFATLFPRADWGHFRPLIPLAAPGVAALLATGIKRFHPVFKGILAVCVFVTVFGLTLASPALRPEPQAKLFSPMAGGVTADPATAREINSLVLEIQAVTKPSEPIFVVPWAPMVYFLAERENPTSARIIWPGQWNHSPYIDETIRRLESSGVNTIVWVNGQEKISGQPFQEYAPAMQQYLDRTFEPVKRIDRYQMLQRIGGRPKI